MVGDARLATEIDTGVLMYVEEVGGRETQQIRPLPASE